MSHSDSARNAARSLLHEVESLLSSDPTWPAPRLTDRHELDELLLAAAELVRGQAEIAKRYTLTRDDRRAVVEESVATALSTGIADLASIGAIGVLVDVTGGSDEIVIATALARIMATFDADELVLAAIALITGWLTAIARLVDLPTAHVLRILVALGGDSADIDRRRIEPSVQRPSHGDRSGRDRTNCRTRTTAYRTESTTCLPRQPIAPAAERVVELLPALPRRVATAD